YDRANHVLTKHEKQLHALANALLEYETLSGDEIDELVEKGKFDRPDGEVAKPTAVPSAGASIPKAGRNKKGPFGDPKPQGA
ncbi:MAG: cell division protein FtsH, partial [Parasphingorhabdus sp.]